MSESINEELFLKIIEKLHTIFILIAVMIGLLLGQIPAVEVNAEQFIVPFLLLMLYGLFLGIPIKELKRGFENIRFATTSLTINFIWTPLLAWALGAIFLSNQSALWVGFIMLMVTPCTDWYLVFIGIAKGNVIFFMLGNYRYVCFARKIFIGKHKCGIYATHSGFTLFPY